MPAVAYRPADPDSQVVSLVFQDTGLRVDRWLSYEVRSNFLTPADSFHFVVAAEGLPVDIPLKVGVAIRLSVEGRVLIDGYVDAIETSADRSSGWVHHVRGRDRLGQALDCVAEPTFQLKEGGTLAELLQRLFKPLGWVRENQYKLDNEANRNAKTGLRGTPTSKGKKRKPLKTFVLHQTKPYNHESVYHFGSRVAQRHGLWIWASADGESLIISEPDFDQEPIFSLQRSIGGGGNIISGSVTRDMTDQPSVIVADSSSGGGEFGKGRCRAHMNNPAFEIDLDSAVALFERVASGPQLIFGGEPFKKERMRQFRPMFLHDEESKTQEQIQRYVRREMSLLVRKSLVAHYVVEGHGQVVDGGFVAWAPDTVVKVSDEPADLDESMYVLGVNFTKSRTGGTQTSLELIRLGSIMF